MIYCLTIADNGNALERWMGMPLIQQRLRGVSVSDLVCAAGWLIFLRRLLQVDSVCRDGSVSAHVDSDYCKNNDGVSLVRFVAQYGDWLAFCLKRREAVMAADDTSETLSSVGALRRREPAVALQLTRVVLAKAAIIRPVAASRTAIGG